MCDSKFIILGALCGCLFGVVCGAVLGPVITAGWLFTTEPSTIQLVSGPSLTILGLWMGGAIGYSHSDVRDSTQSMKRGRLCVAAGRVAFMLSILLWAPPVVAFTNRLLEALASESTPAFAAPWLLLVNAGGAVVLSLWLGATGRPKQSRNRNRRLATGCAFSSLSVATACAWLLNGGAFALVFDA